MRAFFVFPAVLLLGLNACRDPKIQAYRVASETPEPLPPVLAAAPPAPTSPASAASAGATMAGTPVATAAGGALTWSAPPHWKAKPVSPMRKGSYAVPGEANAEADFSITAFPGDVGGEVANFNRWRGQISLPPLAASELEPQVTRFEANNLRFAVAEFANENSKPPQRMLGAIVPVEGATWFFKLAGPDTLVTQEKPAFFALLRTVKASAPATR